MDPRLSEGYTIAAVSKLTGISCHALRVWERRYGFPEPIRTESGHRRYRAEQVDLLRKIAEEVQTGRSISAVMNDLRSSPMDDEVDSFPSTSEPSPVSEIPAWTALLDRLGEGELGAAEAEFDRLSRGLTSAEQLELLIEPAMIEVGERWYRGEFQICQEHIASGFLRRKLAELYESARLANDNPSRRVLIGTVQGDRHEGGVLMVGLLLELKGWRAIDMGTDLPIREYQRAIELWHPDALAVSFVLSRNVNKRFEELSRLRGARVFVGGRSILNYRSLARRYGLTPLPGPGRPAVESLIAEVEGRAPVTVDATR